MKNNPMILIHFDPEEEKLCACKDDEEKEDWKEVDVNQKFTMDYEGSKIELTSYDGGYGPVIEITTPEGRKYSVLLSPSDESTIGLV